MWQALSDVYSERYVICYYDLDVSARIKPSSLLRIMNNTSDNHCVALGLSYSQLKDTGKAFMVSRMSIKVNRMPEYCQPVEVRTWSACVERAVFKRNGDMLDESGNRLLYWTGSWGLIDVVNHKVLRPSELGFDVPHAGNLGVDIEPRRLTATDGIFENSPELNHQVQYSELDCNDHVNNTVYLDYAMNSMPLDIARGIEIDELHINFVHEVLPTDTLSIKSAATGDGLLTRGTVCGSTCFISLIKPK